MNKVFIVILNWNGGKDTLECLDSLLHCYITVKQNRIEIVVVDNGSTDGSVEELKNKNTEINNKFAIIENKKNLGFAEGNNVGIKYALENGADYIFLLNNDTLANQNLVDKLLEAMENDKSIGIAGPKIYFAPGYEFHKDRYKNEDKGKVLWYAGGIIDWKNIYASHKGVDEVDHGQHDELSETDFVTGCAMMLKREVFERIGLFDKRYFLYWEDNDFCQRAKRAGFKVVYVPQASMWHKNASSSDKPGSTTHQYYQTRNRLLFGMKYGQLRTKFALFRESLRFLLAGGIKQQAVSDFYLRKFGARVNI